MHSLLKKCSNCGNLQEVLSKLECSILYAIKRKHSILTLNLIGDFDEDRFKSMLLYKRVIARRMYDCTYPNASIKNSSLVEKASQLALRGPNCSECETCFPEITD